MNEVLKIIHERRSVRDFKPDQIKEDDLKAILEAGRQAPSAWNRQPWYFTVVQKKSLLDKMVDSAKGALQKNPSEQIKSMPWLIAPNFHYFFNAPTVIFISGQNSVENASGDCAVALMNMYYAAQSLGLQACVVVTALSALSTESGPGFMKDLEIPEGYTPMYTLVVGYTSKPIPMAAPRKEDFVNFIK
ncbi:MAG: nitroreductase family protein [Endomicrobium sp.]|jgi:nitroreductase|nr:nitroreductase family protein [Endomicrobium sp.]